MDEYGNVEYSLGVAEAIDVEATEGSSAEFEGHAVSITLFSFSM